MNTDWKYRIVFSPKFHYRLTRHSLFWLVRILMCFVIGIPFVHSTELLELFSLRRLFYNYIHDIFLFDIPFTYFVCYILIPKYLLRAKYAQFGITLLISFVLFATTFILSEYTNIRSIELSNGTSVTPFDIIFVIWKLKVFLTYTIVSFILFTTIKLYKAWYLKEKENQQLIKLNKEAKIEVLQSRIHPHFLFNALNTIYSFTFYDQMKSKVMLNNLYNILHYMIHDCNAEYILITKEIQTLLDYINLEKERYGDRLKLTIHQIGSLEGKLITPLLLQPFVENAFKHGASKIISQPWIDISIKIMEESLLFSISNGTPLSNSTSKNVGIGIDNIKNRLNILYPNRYLLNINRAEGSFGIELVVPIHLQ